MIIKMLLIAITLPRSYFKLESSSDSTSFTAFLFLPLLLEESSFYNSFILDPLV